MHFIEDWFGISPDGGSGTLEVLYLVVIAVILAMAVLRRRGASLLRRRRKP
jgi:hypothetical protein